MPAQILDDAPAVHDALGGTRLPVGDIPYRHAPCAPRFGGARAFGRQHGPRKVDGLGVPSNEIGGRVACVLRETRSEQQNPGLAHAACCESVVGCPRERVEEWARRAGRPAPALRLFFTAMRSARPPNRTTSRTRRWERSSP